jgi:hypothetical protein
MDETELDDRKVENEKKGFSEKTRGEPLTKFHKTAIVGCLI